MHSAPGLNPSKFISNLLGFGFYPRQIESFTRLQHVYTVPEPRTILQGHSQIFQGRLVAFVPLGKGPECMGTMVFAPNMMAACMASSGFMWACFMKARGS